MPTERLPMRQVREILRQKWLLGRSHRDIARSLGISAGAVGETVRRAKEAGFTQFAEVDTLAASALERRLYPSSAEAERPRPDCAWIHRERRYPGVTLELLHLEYVQDNPNGYGYTRFCDMYRAWLKQRSYSMRQVHRGGEKTFVDYSGKKPCIWDPKTGERIDVELFVAVVGASNYTYAEATPTQRGPDWISSHCHAVQYFGGATEVVVCDQLRSGVTAPCRYEPGIQRTYEEWAEHYGTSVIPARPHHPKDKAKVETAVRVAQRWILARLRHEKHFSIVSLNERIWELLEDLNNRQMRIYKRSRREMFERLDKPMLRPLPERPFSYGEWKAVKVNIDYHVEVDGHYYSVPHQHVGEQVEARMSAFTVEVIRDGQRIASHARSFQRGRHTTVPEHMPAAHRKHMQWSPSRIANWAATIGPQTRLLVERILGDRPHPEQGYRSCLGILRLEKRYGASRLEAACTRAVAVGARSYRHVDSILKNGLDASPLPSQENSSRAAPAAHSNIRGPNYYN
ncbi:MAG: IS21 family transposase [Myxococcales bacterium]|nr:IS21 family transposase [Myxococcales bacterium]